MRRFGTAGLITALVLTAGCAERGLVAGPSSSNGPGTWIVVAAAGIASGLVLAALILLPGRPRQGSPVASTVLALQAAGASIATAILLGAAIRSGQLRTQPADREQAASLLRLTRLDGIDSGFFPLMAVLITILGLLVVLSLALAARCAASPAWSHRALAAGLLAVETVLCSAALVLVVLGQRGLPVTVPAAAVPVVALATVAAWPGGRFGTRPAEGAPVLYNDPHG